MTATPLPPDDELVSAYLDGEATDDERARVESDPTLVARVAELRAVTAAVAAPVAPLDEVARRRLLDAALAATEVAAPDPVVALASRRRRPAAWIGAAAAAVTAVVLVSVLPGGDGADDGDVALRDDEVTVLEAAPEADDEAAPEADDEAAPGAVVADGSAEDSAGDSADAAESATADEAAASVFLGTLPDVDAAVAQARDLARDAPPAGPTVAACPGPDRAATLVLDATADVAGVVYLVRVWSDGGDGGDGGEIEIVDSTDCSVVRRAER